MKINELFAKPVDRAIEGVIKADDDEHIFQEVDEYVVTNEIGKRLDSLLEEYNDYQGGNGAWISGFFGSGKSHLLKILSYLLENRIFLGDEDMPVADLFLPKLAHDAMLKSAMEKAIAIPSKSILFNIDQKADTVASNQSDAVLSVFMKVFDEMCGYYAKIPWLAEIERDLDHRGKYDTFKETFAEVSDSTWEEERDMILLEEEDFAKALAKTEGMSEDDARRTLQRYESTYQLSIEDFADKVKEYIDRQEPGFRLNFFVDEVGQYIAGNIKLMTNLQTIAESLATKCKGQAWILVTSQEEMDDVIGRMDRSEANDFSKIQDRFRIRLKLTSANVSEVIQKRLLAKKPEALPELHQLYGQHKNDLRTLFRFSDNTRKYSHFRDQDHFAIAYPFQPYQFELFQSAIRGLSLHNAFEGKHRSVGERSMLGVFQDVAKRIGSDQTGKLATFDLMFEGLRTAMVSQIQHDINQAEQRLNSDLAVQLLKSLLLVKFVKEFRSTPRNLAVLLIDSFEIDLAQHEERVKEALQELERQTYIQRNGDVYEFLTDEEKDIEQEIKNTEVEQTSLNKLMIDLVYRDILGDLRRIRFDDNQQDYPFTRKLDDALYGRESDLGINVITPEHPNFGNLSALSGNSMGKSELFVVLPEPKRLMEDMRLYRQTEKYCSLNQSASLKENIRQILAGKSMANRNRYSNLRNECADLLSRATLLVNGQQLDIQSGDPRTRVVKGFHELIRVTYPNIRMLRVNYTEDHIEQILLKSSEDLFSGSDSTMSEAESEMLSYINRNKAGGERTTVKKLLDQFNGKPYGWWQAGILCVLSKLFKRSKVEIKQDSNPLEDTQVLNNLKNNRTYSNTVIEPQQEFSQRHTRALKDLHREFFHKQNPHTEARDVALAFRQRLSKEKLDLDELLNDRDNYPFLSALEEPTRRLRELAGNDYPFFLNNVEDLEDELLDMREHTMDPIIEFMSDPRQKIYDEARNFLMREDVNLPYLDSDKIDAVRAILNDDAPYRGNKVQKVKATLQDLNNEVDSVVREERKQAEDRIQGMVERLQQADEFRNIKPEQQQEILAPFETLKTEVADDKLVPVIRQSIDNFQNRQYQKQLQHMVKLAQADRYPSPDDDKEQEVQEPQFVAARSLQTDYKKAYLSTEKDVEEYLDQLRKAMLAAIKDGKRINL